MNYPPARKTDFKETLHQVDVPDAYRWMEEIDNPEVQQWIAAQNKLCENWLHAQPERAEIREQMRALWNFEKFGIPQKFGNRYFYTYNNGLQNQAVLYWMDALNGEPTLLLDPNTLSEDGTVALAGINISHDGKYLAYGISDAGSDWQTWHVREASTGKDLADELSWIKFSEAAWDVDDAGFYYSRYDAPQAGQVLKQNQFEQKVFYHRLGTPQSADQLIYHRPDQPEWGFNANVTEDGQYLCLHVWQGSHIENGFFYCDLTQPNQPFVELLAGFDAEYAYVANIDTAFYFQTTHNAPKGRVIRIDLQNPAVENWQEIIPEAQDVLQEVHCVGGVLFCNYLHDAVAKVTLHDIAGKPLQVLALPGLGTVMGFSGGMKHEETFFSFTNFTTPTAIYRYDLQTGQISKFREPRVAFDPTEYVTKQVFYPGKDGTLIPLFISHRKDLIINGDVPTYLFGYGGFNIAIAVNFKPEVLTWMARGGIYAQAHLRGGSEYGQAWHEAGMRHNKQNVFDDFIAAAEWLIAQGYTRTKKLAIGGRSNGGLLVGACLTQRPDLFGVCLPNVGVMDMLRFHKFTIGWGWVSDYGSPDDEEDFKVLLAYSPYHNIKFGVKYPPTMVLTGDHDDRVYPAHSFKFAAALQAAQAGGAPILIRIETRAGHGVGKPTAKQIDEFTDMWVFALANMREADE